MKRTHMAQLLRGLRREGYLSAAWRIRANFYGVPGCLVGNLRAAILLKRNLLQS